MGYTVMNENLYGKLERKEWGLQDPMKGACREPRLPVSFCRQRHPCPMNDDLALLLLSFQRQIRLSVQSTIYTVFTLTLSRV